MTAIERHRSPNPARNGKSRWICLCATIFVCAMLVTTVVIAQRYGRGWGRGGRMPDRSQFPTWDNAPDFEQDVFTFVRIKYTPHYRRDWTADYPDADWNISLRLQQLTSLEVNPDPIVLELTDPRLFDYPFIFMTAPMSVIYTKDEAECLRRYLLHGGFMMVDEFWGLAQRRHFFAQMKRVFPEFQPRALSIDHEIFQIVYPFKKFPQATAIHFWQMGYDYHPVAEDLYYDHAPIFYGIFDEQERMMALLCYNNDLCDGWEREGEDKEFFQRFSVQNSYPMGINIITYAMTH